MSEERVKLRRPPHPTAGLLVAIPIPVPPVETPRVDREQYIHRAIDGYMVDLSGLLATGPDIIAGIIMEIGPNLPGRVTESFEDMGEGTTIYYPQSRVIPIGEFHYLRTDDVIAWDSAPE